jgi:putative aminopeptidase FrvX
VSCAATTVAAQGVARSADELAGRLAGMGAVTGFEQQMVDTLLALLPGSRRDRAGNAVLTLGSGSARRLVVCPLDEPGFVVGQVRDDGYLTLRRSPGAPRGNDGQLEGQRVSIATASGLVPGVVAVRSIHLTRGRDPIVGGFTVDSAMVDVGAASKAEAESLGIRTLAPVTLSKRPHRYGGDRLAAPLAGRRAACAALVVAARQVAARQGMIPRRQSVVIAFLVEYQLSIRGLGTLAHSAGPFQETLILGEESAETAGLGQQLSALGAVTAKSLPLRYAGTPVESVVLSDVERLADELASWIGATR